MTDIKDEKIPLQNINIIESKKDNNNLYVKCEYCKGTGFINNNRYIEDHIISDDKNKNIWSSCCIRVDKRMVLFVTQFFFSCAAMAFGMKEINESDSCFGEGLITIILGYWMPNPKVS